MIRAAKLLTVLALAGTAIGMGGCSTADDPAAEQSEIIENLVSAGYPREDIQVVDQKVYVGFDAHVTLTASREMLGIAGREEQYRTNNLVGSGVHTICASPTAYFNSFPKLSQGLDDAIARYNAQNLTIRYVRGSSGCDATTVVEAEAGTVGGHSGFPSGGLPYNIAYIGTGLTSYSAGVNAHVIMHELGHTIGFRHSDYYRRSISCGPGGGKEQPGSIGAILIPGTPSTAVVGGSVMNSCFRSSETGLWTSTDITALNYLY